MKALRKELVFHVLVYKSDVLLNDAKESGIFEKAILRKTVLALESILKPVNTYTDTHTHTHTHTHTLTPTPTPLCYKI